MASKKKAAKKADKKTTKTPFGDVEPVPRPPVEEAPVEETPEETITKLQREVKRKDSIIGIKNAEIARLKDKQKSLKEQQVKKVGKRYQTKVDEADAPAKDPAFGDLTPEYVEWFLKTQKKEVCEERYRGRIDDDLLDKK